MNEKIEINLTQETSTPAAPSSLSESGLSDAKYENHTQKTQKTTSSSGNYLISTPRSAIKDSRTKRRPKCFLCRHRLELVFQVCRCDRMFCSICIDINIHECKSLLPVQVKVPVTATFPPSASVTVKKKQ